MKHLLMLTILMLTLSSFKMNLNEKRKGDDWIPAAFDSRNVVLLVKNVSGPGNERAQKIWEKVNLEIAAIMKQEYPYRYEFTSTEVEKNTKYDDKEKYRYLLVHTYNMGGESEKGVISGWAHFYHIYDRKEDKHYPDVPRATSPQAVFKKTVQELVEHQKTLN